MDDNHLPHAPMHGQAMHILSSMQAIQGQQIDDFGVLMSSMPPHQQQLLQQAPAADGDAAATAEGEGKGEAGKKKRTLKELDLGTKWAIVARCVGFYDHDKGRIKQGKLSEIGQMFDVTDEVVRKLFLYYMKQVNDNVLVPDLGSARLSVATKKVKQDIAGRVEALHRESQGKLTVRAMSELYKERYGNPLPKSTMHEYIQRLGLSNKG